ncbi:MAG: hypothetical protein Ct9H300mP28_14450 [Pseudomonadota bacterium]|nr:MAG: hypothetical protein Ct9H300mP28_14450 [Pseudomonadota bacterium]
MKASDLFVKALEEEGVEHILVFQEKKTLIFSTHSGTHQSS